LRVLALVGLAMIGCEGQDDDPIEGSFVDISIDPGPGGFDHLELYYGSGSPDSKPIATPAILSGTEPPAAAVTSYVGGSLLRIDHGGSYHYRLWDLRFAHPVYIGVAAIGGNGAKAGGSSGPIEHPENSAIRITLDPALRPELWGTPTASGQCFRLKTGSSTFFVLRGSDPDCDGITGSQDSQPYAFCDPAATSQAGRDACL
jgi:hypothetical protein